MKTSIVTLLITFCFYLSVYAQAPQDKATELKEQALSSLKQKDYIKARYLFKKAYEAFAVRENYPQAIECGIQANALYVRENFYKEGFELCRNMEQLIWTGEQKQNKVFYDLRFPISKERLQMYISLKNPAQAKNQLDKLEEIASLAKNDSLMEVLLYTKANYYYTFNQNTQGDACFRKLISQYKEKKDYDKVSDCYKTLIGIARKANNAPLMERTYESYIVWTDSVKALTAQDELNVLKRKYDESLQTIQDKEAEVSGLREKEIRLRNKEAELREALFRRMPFFHKLPSLHANNNQDEPGTSHKIVVTDAEWAEVTSVVNDAFDNFVVRLRQAYPQLGDKEIGFCCLVKINVNIQDLSDIYCVSKAAITKRKYRIKTDKLGITDENISLDSFLKVF